MVGIRSTQLIKKAVVKMSELKDHYSMTYRESNFFGYREWLHAPYVAALVSRSRLREGSSVLDAACGYGFFSYLFHRCGMRVCGIDLSVTGSRAAQSAYGALGMKFVVGDLRAIPFSMKFDCVFTRSCSLCNTDEFPTTRETTDGLLRYVRDGGTFIFAYGTKLGGPRKSRSWRNRTLGDVKKHFSPYLNARVFFVSKVDTLLMRKHAFNSLPTKLNMLLSKRFGWGATSFAFSDMAELPWNTGVRRGLNSPE